MPSAAEIRARERLAKMPGYRVGSNLHLCEMLLAELDEARKTLAWARPYVRTCADEDGKDNASAALRGINALLENKGRWVVRHAGILITGPGAFETRAAAEQWASWCYSWRAVWTVVQL